MGYTTDFEGQFNLNRPLEDHHAAYLKAFAGTRRMKRNAALTQQRPDPLRLAAGLPVGDEGGYFVGSEEDYGQEHTEDVLEYNSPPIGQPSLWNQWLPNDAGDGIIWDEGEKFYSYTGWIEYLIANFFAPWGYVLNGRMKWQGEDSSDRGIISVVDNQVSTNDYKFFTKKTFHSIPVTVYLDETGQVVKYDAPASHPSFEELREQLIEQAVRKIGWEICAGECGPEEIVHCYQPEASAEKSFKVKFDATNGDFVLEPI